MAENQPTHTPPEEQPPVLGHEGAYEVSNHGRVRSLDRTIIYKNGRVQQYPGRILKLLPASNAYLQVKVDSKKLVHRLVLEAFVGPPREGEECRHLDGNPKNNHLTNLRWGSRRENSLDRTRHGTDRNASKTHCPRGHRLEGPNLILAHLKRGRRGCLACDRALKHAKYHGITSEFLIQNLADQKHHIIMGG